jgi:hypothetical protein
MRTRLVWVVICVLLSTFVLSAQTGGERIDTAAAAKIKEEGLKRSQVMDLISTLCDVQGPRLTWSPEYRQAAKWAEKKLAEFGLANVHEENWAPLGKGWSLKEFSASVTTPHPFPLIAYPSAWSPGVNDKEADVVFLDVKSMEDFTKYTGKLKNKFVLISNPQDVRAPFEALARRTADSLLLRMANADAQGGRRRGGLRGPFPRIVPANFDSLLQAVRQISPNIDSATVAQMIADRTVGPRKLQFVQEQGALAVLTAGRGDGGLLFVQQATVPQPPDVPFNQRVSAYDADAPKILPQIVVAAEHYNRMVRMIQKGERVRVKVLLDVETTKADSGFNIIAEIPGTDLKDEIVMIGGHFDSWHGGTGATDDATGSAACMEAMRILQKMVKEYGFKPRRTIRIGLWGGEEQGLIGSAAYVTAHFGKMETDATAPMGGMFGGGGTLKTLPDHEKFSVYFNHDNGSGRLRGIYLQGNEAARQIFRTWLRVYDDPTAQTVSAQNTGGTDHQSFDRVNLPGFQFIQDPLDYETRTHHSNMDVYERVQPEDMKQAATIIATFAYQAAMRDAQFPRKPMPTPR